MRRTQGHNLSITFLGTSGSWPTKDRNVSATAIKRGGEILLFDCGEGTQRQFQKTALSHMQVSKIFLTHFHGDHTYGLPGYLKTMQLNERTEDLHIFGPPGIHKVVEAMDRIAPIKAGFSIKVHAMASGDSIEFPEGYTVTAAQGDHSIQALAYRIQEPPRTGRFDKPKALDMGVPEGPAFGRLQRGEDVTLQDGTTVRSRDVVGPSRSGRTIVISGDTRPCDRIATLAEGADILIHEATYTDEHQDLAIENKHSTAREAAQIAKQAGVQTLWLHHFSPRYTVSDVHLAEARTVFADTECADDLLTTDVPFVE